MIYSFTRTAFAVSLVVALLGGIALVATQTLGLFIGDQELLTAPNRVFKIVLCLAASLAAIAGYLLGHVKRDGPQAPEPPAPTEDGENR